MRVRNFCFIIVLVLFAACTSNKAVTDPWDMVPEILSQIKEPVFADNTITITDFGAIADGTTLNTKAINDAVKACNEQGGGTVLVPDGVFFTGAIHLLSNVRLHLSDNAELKFSVNPSDYLPLVYTRWEGIDCYNYSPLIYAIDQENIAITGKGKLNGNSTNNDWWPWKGKTEYGWSEGQPSQLDLHARPMLDTLNRKKVPVEERIMGEGFYLRPQFVNFMRCKNILMSDFTITDSPFWVLHPVLSENIIVRGLKILSLGPNSDGCDPESCKNVLIEDCHFKTGDDCIAIKSGRNNDGILMNIPSENMVIRNCFMEDGHGGVVIGSEISGGARNIFAENCIMDSPELDRAIRLKSNANRSGVIENLYVRNITVGEVKEAILHIDLVYDIRKEGTDTLYPVVRNIILDNVTCKKTRHSAFVLGIEGQELISNIQIKNSNFQGVAKDDRIENAPAVLYSNVTINDKVVGQ